MYLVFVCSASCINLQHYEINGWYAGLHGAPLNQRHVDYIWISISTCMVYAKDRHENPQSPFTVTIRYYAFVHSLLVKLKQRSIQCHSFIRTLIWALFWFHSFSYILHRRWRKLSPFCISRRFDFWNRSKYVAHSMSIRSHKLDLSIFYWQTEIANRIECTNDNNKKNARTEIKSLNECEE